MESGVTVWGQREVEGEVEHYPVAFFSVHQCGSLEECEELAEFEANWQPMGTRERALYEAGLERVNREYLGMAEDEPEEGEVAAEEIPPPPKAKPHVGYRPTAEEIAGAEEFYVPISRADRLRGTIVTDRGQKNV